MKALRTPDDRFVDLPDFPFEPHYVTVARRRRGRAARALPRRGAGRRRAGAADARRAVVGVPLPQDDPGPGRGRPPLRRTRPRRVRPVGQAGGAVRLHLRPPRRVDAQRPVRRARPAATSRSSARTGVASSACASSPPTPTASTGSSSPTPACPPATPRPRDAFLAWQRFSKEAEEFPIGGIINGGCLSDLPAEVVAAYDAPFPDDIVQGRGAQLPVPRADRLRRPGPRRPGAAWEVLGRFDRPVPVRLQRRRPDHQGRRAGVPPRRARHRGPAPHDHRGRRPLPPGGQGPRGRRGRRRLHRRQLSTGPLRLTLLGTGSPLPDPNRAGPSTLVQAGDANAPRRRRAGRPDAPRGCRPAAARRCRRCCSPTSTATTSPTSTTSSPPMGASPVPTPLPVFGPPGTQQVVDGILAMLGTRHRLPHRPPRRPRRAAAGRGDRGRAAATRSSWPGRPSGSAAPTTDRSSRPSAIGSSTTAQSLVLGGDGVPCAGARRAVRRRRRLRPDGHPRRPRRGHPDPTAPGHPRLPLLGGAGGPDRQPGRGRPASCSPTTCPPQPPAASTSGGRSPPSTSAARSSPQTTAPSSTSRPTDLPICDPLIGDGPGGVERRRQASDRQLGDEYLLTGVTITVTGG